MGTCSRPMLPHSIRVRRMRRAPSPMFEYRPCRTERPAAAATRSWRCCALGSRQRDSRAGSGGVRRLLQLPYGRNIACARCASCGRTRATSRLGSQTGSHGSRPRPRWRRSPAPACGSACAAREPGIAARGGERERPAFTLACVHAGDGPVARLNCRPIPLHREPLAPPCCPSITSTPSGARKSTG
jgi:hypothetical protein